MAGAGPVCVQLPSERYPYGNYLPEVGAALPSVVGLTRSWENQRITQVLAVRAADVDGVPPGESFYTGQCCEVRGSCPPTGSSILFSFETDVAGG